MVVVEPVREEGSELSAHCTQENGQDGEAGKQGILDENVNALCYATRVLSERGNESIHVNIELFSQYLTLFFHRAKKIRRRKMAANRRRYQNQTRWHSSKLHSSTRLHLDPR